MPKIDTLVEDIAALWDKEIPITDELIAQLGVGVAMKTKTAFERGARERKEKVLYASEVGKPCLRQLYYSYHLPHYAEKLPPSARTKFLYGDILEEYVLMLAKAAGHSVTDEQTPVEFAVGKKGWRVRGRMDAVIDGVLVDVKSCSSYSYKKFQEGLNDTNDAFGYRMQLWTYSIGGTTPYLERGFVAIDKQLGHIGYFPIHYENPLPRINEITEALDAYPTLPERAFVEEPEGKSGNMKLPMACSYCPFKAACWANANGGAGLRAFAYSYGPVYLTKTTRTPNVPEILIEAPSNPSV